tara:strand:- start:480 stop:824 length:345 start_codon:yes stop_codon:yes gene_type:complete
MIFYKIKRGELYSTGGSWPSWVERGKTWMRMRDLRAHLRTVRLPSHRTQHYEGAEVVTLETVQIDAVPVMEVLQDVRAVSAANRAKEVEVSKRQRAEWLRKELEKTQAELARLT